MKNLLLSLLFIGLPLSAREAKEPVVFDPAFPLETLWETPVDDFAETHKELGFQWLSAEKNSAQSLHPGKFLELPVCQSVARFENEKLAEVELHLYTRGDSGTLSRTKYEALIQQATDTLIQKTAVRAVPRGKSGAVKAEGVTWKTSQSIFLLEYSATRTPQIPFRAEFIRLRITPVKQSKGLVTDAFETRRKQQFKGTDHVTREENGDVLIKDIPMVDQGPKGYCVVASCERVLRYYGIQTDANELAQLANSDAARGTSVEAFAESLKKLTMRLKIYSKTVYKINFDQLFNDYNQAAKKVKDTGINTGSRELSIIYAQMNPDILRIARTKRPSELESFKRNIKTRINAGIPVLWSVILGVMPGDGSNTSFPGGHMRLIIGYNDTTQELLFSDSWGAGHELKRMPILDAWAITTFMAAVEPFKN